MISLIDLEKSVVNLTTEELIVFRAWFWEFDNQVWDNKLEQDIQLGKLDVMAEQAIQDYSKGKFAANVLPRRTRGNKDSLQLMRQ